MVLTACIVLVGSLLPAQLAAASSSTIRITASIASGPGSIREAIDKANTAEAPVRIVSALAAGTVVYVFRQLPALTGYGIELDARGMVLKGGECVRPDGRKGCDGLVISGPAITVKRLRTTGFLFDGISVHGTAARDVRILECSAWGNQDDGIGIAAGALRILVQNCVLERNGFRTKGKGILVFDGAQATLRNNMVRFNRDGITVSRRAQAILIENMITENYDKGLGVAGARATGTGNAILANGRGGSLADPVPNADGLRVTLSSTVVLENTRIERNGDTGLVSIGTSKVTLHGGSIRGNEGVGVNVRNQAVVELFAVEVTGNGRGDFRQEGEGKLLRRPPALP